MSSRIGIRITLVVSGAALTVAQAGEIHWRGGAVQTGLKTPREIEETITEALSHGERQHLVVRFCQPIGPSERDALEQDGLKLLNYLGDNAFFAVVWRAELDAPALARATSLEEVLTIQRAWKLDPRVLAGKVPDYAIVQTDTTGNIVVALYVLFHPDVPLFPDAANTVKRLNGVIRSDLESVNGLVVELPLANLDTLADEDTIQWIEWPLPRMSEINDSSRAITEADIAQAPPYNLDGSGVNVLVYDGAYARETHVDYQGRLTVRDTSGLSNHATVCPPIGCLANSFYGVECVPGEAARRCRAVR